jgi:hypothetical protein
VTNPDAAERLRWTVRPVSALLGSAHDRLIWEEDTAVADSDGASRSAADATPVNPVTRKRKVRARQAAARVMDFSSDRRFPWAGSALPKGSPGSVEIEVALK